MGILVACSHCNRDSCLPAGQSLLFLCIRQWFPSWRPVFLLPLCSQKQQSASLPSLLLSTRYKPSQATPGSPQLHSCPSVPKSPRSTRIKSLLLLLLNPKRHLWRKTLEMPWKMPMCLSGYREQLCNCLRLESEANLGAAKGNFWAGKATSMTNSLPVSYSRFVAERGRDPEQTSISCTSIQNLGPCLVG